MEMCDVFLHFPLNIIISMYVVTNLSYDPVVHRRWHRALCRLGNVPATACPIHCPNCYDPVNTKQMCIDFIYLFTKINVKKCTSKCPTLALANPLDF